MKERSESCLVHRAIDVNSWLRATPGVDEARPSKCPRCGAAGRPIGGPISLIGHGMRSRQIKPDAGGAGRRPPSSCLRDATAVADAAVQRRWFLAGLWRGGTMVRARSPWLASCLGCPGSRSPMSADEWRLASRTSRGGRHCGAGSPQFTPDCSSRSCDVGRPVSISPVVPSASPPP